MPTILLVESARRKASFAPALVRRKYEVVRVTTTRQAIKQARLTRPDLIVLDSTTQRIDGIRICRDLRAQLKDAIILLLLQADIKTESAADADFILHEPFTPRKLLNRIARMLPGEQQDILQVGEITLNLTNRCVRTGKQEYQLTPKQSQLLALFMRQPDEVVSRRVLMKNVWDTDYMGDTRTLDVHIRWLREIIEADPSQPCNLVTVRGVGYKLLAPPSNNHK